MKPGTLDALIWALIYAGLIGVGLGISVQGSDSALGTTVIVAGAVIAAIGFALIYVRSRMKSNDSPTSDKKP